MIPPSEGRLGVVLCRDDCQLGLSHFELGLDLAALRDIAGVFQFGPQFFDVLFDRQRLISLSL